MRLLQPCGALVASAALAAGLSACGGAAKAASSSLPAPGFGKPNSTPYRGDGDFDIGDGDTDNNRDTDEDAPFDYYYRSNESSNKAYFHDRDDLSELTFGKSASSAEAQAITRIVIRYYTLASHDDGRDACEMLLPGIKASIHQYRLTGIPYLRGARTCPEAMDRLFRHENLTVPTVTNVRVSGDTAIVLWGSRSMPAGYMTLLSRHRSWVISAAVGSTLL